MFHLIFCLAIDNIQSFLWQLNIARPRIRIMMLQHNLNYMVDLDITAVSNDELHHFNRSVLIILIFLLFIMHFFDALGHAVVVLGEVDCFLQLEFFEQAEEEKSHLDLVSVGEARLACFLVALVY